MTKTVETLIHLSETQKFLHRGQAWFPRLAVKTPAQLNSPGTYFLWIPTAIPSKETSFPNSLFCENSEVQLWPHTFAFKKG